MTPVTVIIQEIVPRDEQQNEKLKNIPSINHAESNASYASNAREIRFDLREIDKFDDILHTLYGIS